MLGLAACNTQPQPSVQQVATSSTNALKKISYKSAEELQRLRDSGAEIIVQQADYVIVRTDSATVSAFAANATTAQEQDLIQRLAHVQLRDSSDVQRIVDSGVDLWEVNADTAIVRAFDIQLERLRQAGMSLRVVKTDASKEEGKR
ncbi:MAG: hypothetical protein AAB354_02810 [candidate division KSB1 bacterium]